jgi:hypothetical protein
MLRNSELEESAVPCLKMEWVTRHEETVRSNCILPTPGMGLQVKARPAHTLI